jgi:predicted metalloprotease with PDZ domain
MPKDRIGLYLAGLRGDLSGGLVVAFVSPRSPAEAGGLKAQDRVVKIDGKVLADWPPAALVALDMTAPGVTHAFTLAGGEVRTVTARDFF